VTDASETPDARPYDASGEPWETTDIEGYRPSLSNLDREQKDTLDELVDGFVDRAGVLRWVQDLGIVTLGRLPDRFGRELPLSDSMLACLLVDEGERERLGVDDLVDERAAAEALRQRLAGKILPYHRDAVQEFRESAVEYLDADARPDPERADSVAHRPSLAELSDRQERALDALLDGALVDDRDLVGWTRTLNLATEGEIPGEFGERVLTEPGTRRVLLAAADAPDAYEKARVRFAAYHLLPAFNAGVRALWQRAGENTAVETEPLSATSL